MEVKVQLLDHGFIRLLNIAGPTRRPNQPYDASDVDPANSARISFNQFDAAGSQRPESAEFKLAEYLMKNHHNTPIEMIETWWEMKLPIFVARQFIRHRTATVNEVSARYVELPKEWYIPKLADIGHRGANMKQGRIVDGAVLVPMAQTFLDHLNQACEKSYAWYQEAIADGIPPEVARSLLHVNHYTHWVWKQDIHNLFHFLALRIDGHAQFEARQYGERMLQLLSIYLPELCRMFTEYRRIKE